MCRFISSARPNACEPDVLELLLNDCDIHIGNRSRQPVVTILQCLQQQGPAQQADLTLETSGSPGGRLTALRSARTWGTVCLVGESGSMTINVSRDILRKQLTIIGSWTFSITGQSDCARLVADQKIAVDVVLG